MRDTFHADPATVGVAEAMHGLSDPLRLRIVELLARRGETECSVIYRELGISKSNASHHFRVLREIGLLLRNHHGQQQSARLRTDEFEARFPGLLPAVLANIERHGVTAQELDVEHDGDVDLLAAPTNS